MIQAKWHNILFGITTDRLRTITSIDMGGGIQFERNEDSEGKPPTQVVRRKLETLTIEYACMSGFNAWPKGERDMWDIVVSGGIHAPFYVVGGESFSGREFIVKSYSVSSDHINLDGHMLYGTAKVEFEEYAVEPSGLKVDKGVEIGFNGGETEYGQADYEAALRARASNNDKILTLKSIIGGFEHVIV